MKSKCSARPVELIPVMLRVELSRSKWSILALPKIRKKDQLEFLIIPENPVIWKAMLVLAIRPSI
jgi:hypothetical protein